MNERMENSKKLTDWAIAAGRHFQSRQTGYVHLFNGESEQGAQTIPLIENFLFAYALFRSHTVEHAQEAKGLLKGLLIFQNRQEGEGKGNFPVYLHEYPVCRDTGLSVQLLAPFFWILREYGHVLGGDLRQALEAAAQSVLGYALQRSQIKPFPYFLEVRLAAAQFAFGIKEGSKRLEELSQRQLEGWQTTKQLGSVLIGLQMAYPSLSNSIWHSLWERMQQTWHSGLGSYIGPCIREWQDKEEPQVNFYDLFGGYFSGQFSKRATTLNPHHLEGILIHPSTDKFEAGNVSFETEQGAFGGKKELWRMISHPSFAFTLLEKKEPFQLAVDKTHTSFRSVWGNLDRLHSLVCQGGNIEKVLYEQEEESVTLFFDLRDSCVEEENRSKKEIEFFVDVHPEIRFRVNGEAATTFELGQKLEIISDKNHLSIVFELVEGEGRFLGHIMRGNRPSQIDLKRDSRFHAYDWTFFLRGIRRQGPCRLKALLRFSFVKPPLSTT